MSWLYKKYFYIKSCHNNVVVVKSTLFMDKKIFTRWHGVTIPLPTDVWGKAEGSSLSEEQKQAIAKGSVFRRPKTSTDIKFFACDSQGQLMSCIVSVVELNNLARIAKIQKK